MSAFTRFARKHGLFLLLLGALNALIFAPALLNGRVLSPNDVYYHYDPWRTVQPLRAHNAILHDPAFAYGTLASLVKDEWSSFHWNRWIGSGVPGFGSVGAAVFSPFVLLPAVVLPLLLFFSGMVFLKLNAGAVGAYLWLREERLGKRGAAIGAIVFAGAGSYAVWWLWQATNATTLYPLVMFFIARAFHGKRTSILFSFVLAAAFIVSGFPATVVYVLYLGVAYALFLAIVRRRFPLREFVRGSAASLLALAALAPMIAPFVAILRRTGYLETRANAGLMPRFATEHLAAFVNPFRLGDPVAGTWSGYGGPALFIETTVYLGLVTLLLAPLSIVARRRPARFFWLALTGVLLLFLFTTIPGVGAIGELPGIRFSTPTRLRVLLPLAAAYLSAAAIAWMSARLRRWRLALKIAVVVIGGALVVDQARFARHFLTFLEPAVARVPQTETVEWLRSAPGPARVAPMFDALFPNSAEWMRFEDIRSQFSSEAWYRRLLQRIDPECWGSTGTIIQFNSLRVDFRDPFLAMLNVRYIVEQPSIDILRWKIEEASKPAEAFAGELTVAPGAAVKRTIAATGPVPFALFFPASIEGDGEVVVAVANAAGQRRIATRSSAELRRSGKLYAALPRGIRTGEAITIEISAKGCALRIPASAADPAAPGVTFVNYPLIPAAELRESRIFENAAALPRFYPVWSVTEMPFEAMLADRSIDFGRESVVHDSSGAALASRLYAVPEEARRASLEVERYDGRGAVLRTDSRVPFLLASSEKVNDDLRIAIDGAEATPLTINGGFAAVSVEPGSHTVTFERRLGRRYQLLPLLALVMLGGWWFVERRRRR